MHVRLAETMDYVEEKRKELLQSFAGVPGDRLTRHPPTGGWSVAEILDHLGIVESGIARLIAKRAGRARAEGLVDRAPIPIWTKPSLASGAHATRFARRRRRRTASR